jgi:hypothetical protein
MAAVLVSELPETVARRPQSTPPLARTRRRGIVVRDGGDTVAVGDRRANGPDKSTANVSFGSTVVSPTTDTPIVLLVWPGAKLRLPVSAA